MARILYVEDDRKRAQAVCPLLERRGHFVEVVGSAERAMLAVAGRSHYDALLLHLLLPGMDGAELCRWIENRSPLRDIPKVAFTWTGCRLNLDFSNGPPPWLPVDLFMDRLETPQALVEGVESVLARSG